MDVVTVALYRSGSVAVLVNLSDPPHCVNRQWTAALGAIESNEPSPTAGVTPHIKVALVNNTKG